MIISPETWQPAPLRRQPSSVRQAPLRRTLPLLLRRHSVPETAPYGTEYACRAQKGLLRYATHFQRCAKRHPVTPNASSKARRTADSTDCGQPPATLDAFQRRAVPKAAPAHRTHLQCAKRPPLSLFAQAPSTIFFVPLTRNLSPADPSPAPSTALGTGNGPLRYRICVPCSKRPPVVRDASSEAFGAQNRLLRYGRDIRCQKQPPPVRDASSKARRTADSTDCGQPPAHRTHLQRPAAPVPLPPHAYIAAAVPSSKKIKKRGCIPWKSLRIHPLY